MADTVYTLPGYRQSEYRLVIVPHSELREKITSIKKQFSQQYKIPFKSGGNSHLTLARFTQLQMNEDKLLNRFRTIAMGYYPFKVEIKGFGSYPTHSIFLNISTKAPLENLVNQLKTVQRLLKLGEKEPYFLHEPNFLIARTLAPWQYEQGWKEYSRKSFTGRFIADSMLLLKRPAQEKNFQVLERFEFRNLPVIVKQGDLFEAV